jgi:hypothetical protein
MKKNDNKTTQQFLSRCKSANGYSIFGNGTTEQAQAQRTHFDEVADKIYELFIDTFHWVTM